VIWQVLELLEGQYQLTVNKVDVLEGSDSEKKIKQMRTFSGGRNTVPQVFFNSEHLGGNDDVQVSAAANCSVIICDVSLLLLSTALLMYEHQQLCFCFGRAIIIVL
jgi:glutaredoxin